ncbi:MAG: sulfatase-like hydrolase/transferase [Candidatus Latescibacteria bacterium]|nr:sulfatase-like hydrolase/transferase [Candidatus Latescibacterota bacterium]
MADDRPNIIMIVTDQQRYDTIAELGFPHMDTPHLDRLAREGVSFDQCFITAPSCAPARASLFTGYYPHTTGIFKNADRWTKTWVSQLADTGYHCVNIGKMHTFPFETPAGFHERYVVENKDRYLEGRYYFDEWDKALAAQGLVKQQREQYRQRDDYQKALGAFDWELPEHTHSDFFVGDMAQWWLNTKPKPDGPLFMQIGFPGPHPPYDPLPRYVEPYMEKELPIDQVSQEDLDGQPPPLQKMRVHNCEVDHDSVVHQLEPTPEQRHRQRAYYLANVTMIDEKVGEILQTLDERGYIDNSVVIFTSDHGDCLTDHGHSQKWTMYDTITRVPAIVWSPDRFAGGRRVEGLCQWMDLGPTVLEMAGVEPEPSMEAISLLPTLEGQPQELRRHVFAEHSRDGILQETAFMTMVRSDSWKLVSFIDEPMGQLFDLRADPKEERNLWDDPACQEKKGELLEVMRCWLLESNLQSGQWQEGWR